MRVAMYVEGARVRGGIEVYAERHAARLRASGCEVEVLRGPDAAAYARADEVVVHKCGSLAALEGFPAEKTTLYVHDHSMTCPREHGYTPLGRNCARRGGCAACWLCAPLCRNWRGAVRRVAEQRRRLAAMGRLRRLVVISRFMAGRLAANGMAPERISVETPELPGGTPGTLPAGTGPVDLLYAGQLLRGKGVQVLLRALARMRRARTLDVVGAGNHEAKLRRMAERLGVAGRVRWRGAVPDARAWMAAAACVAVPSVWPEPYGLVAAEAVALGRPVVASDVGGLPEACGGKARLVAPGDAAAWAEALDEAP